MPEFCSAVLWDLDGTLVDSEEYHWRAWKETLDREGISITRQDFLSSFLHTATLRNFVLVLAQVERQHPACMGFIIYNQDSAHPIYPSDAKVCRPAGQRVKLKPHERPTCSEGDAGSSGGRKNYREAYSSLHIAREEQVTPMASHDIASDRQAEPRSFRLGGERGLENSCGSVWWDNRSAVLHLNSNRAFVILTGSQLHTTAAG